MPYWRLFYHITWATKHRNLLITPQFAANLHNVIANRASQLGAFVHAVGGIEDHIHLAVSVPPRLALSEFIQQLKGSSSHFANHELGLQDPFAWQAEYGVVSFDGKQLAGIVRYVKEQRQHHLERTTIPILERMTAEEFSNV